LKREILSDKVGTFGRLAMLTQDDHAHRMVSLQVTSLKVEVQGWGSGAGKRKILRNESAEKRLKKSRKPHSLRNQIPKGAPPAVI
jgi:hypothetical protein